ncbi:MAG: carboxy terminal-processing peptidase [Pseudomonadota bacterium]|nr:carboxy terminal-processing peptidase [Pseudomonadota bacterium]
MGNRNKLAAGRLAVLAFVGSTVSFAQGQQVGLDGSHVRELEPLAIHPRTSLTIVDQIRHNHFLKKPLDDSASSEIFDKYVSTLDPGHAYLLQSDLDALNKYRYQLDDALKHADLKPAFAIYNTFHDRLLRRLNALVARLEDGVEKFNFDADETLQIDREGAPWSENETANDALWDRRLKASILSMRLSDRDLGDIQDVLLKRYRNRLKQAQQTRSEDAFQLYINAFASTYDPHTQYLSPRSSENFNMTMSLSLQGIGAVLRTEDDYTSVVRLVTAGPADKAGELRPADRIVSVGQGERGKLIDVVGWRLDDVVELIRGPKGTIVRLGLVDNSGDEESSRVIRIKRDTVKLEDQAAKKRVFTLESELGDVRIGVLEIPTFYVDFNAVRRGDKDFKSTTRDVNKLIEELKVEGVDGLVVDLRSNGGGSLQEAQSLTGLFIRTGPTVQVRKARRPNARVYRDEDGRTAWDGPLAVLVNRLSASASEIFAGAIQDYQRGLVIGTQTFGKGTVQTLVPLNRGQLKITEAKFYRVSGDSTQHQGIVPDITYPDVFGIDNIGESTLEDALTWDTIKPTSYRQTNGVEPYLDRLRMNHERRVAQDPDFAYLRSLSDWRRQKRAETHISLNQATRVNEKEADDVWRLDLENALLIAKGEDPVTNLKELETRRSQREAEKISGSDEDPDPLVIETGNILMDYINLSGSNRHTAQASN